MPLTESGNYKGNIAILANPAAGKGKSASLLRKITAELERLRISHTVFTTQWPEDLEGFTSAWIVGGDGTLNYFINKFPLVELPIAVFKGGSGNDFAWKLYRDKGFQEVFDLALSGRSRRVDLGICNGKYFLNGVGLGFDGEVVKALGNKRILPGKLSYLLVILKKIFFYREGEVEISADNYHTKGHLFMVSIANGSRYGGGFLVAPGASFSDGLLDLVTIGPIPPVSRIFYLPLVMKGRHMGLPFVRLMRVRKLFVQSTQILRGHLDGELTEGNRFELEILPGKLSFFY